MKTSKWNSIYRDLKERNLLSATLVCTFFFLLMSSCKGQANKENESLGDLLLNDSANKPQINVKVNKQYDKNGKMLRYDSTYTYVYKGGSGKSFPMNNDTIFNNFKSYFNIHSQDMFDHQKNAIFLNDSLFKYDFFNDDYFQKRFELNQHLFGDFYKQMDSLKGNYLRETYPNRNKN